MSNKQKTEQNEQKEREDRDEDIRELVKARLGTMPIGFSMSIGGGKKVSGRFYHY